MVPITSRRSERRSNRAFSFVCEPLDRRVLMAAGDPDPTFANGFPATISFPGAAFQVNDVAMQSDGKIIAAGSKAGSMAVTRFNVDGTLDTAFGSGGLFESDRAPEARGIAIQSDGKILLATGPHPGGFDFQAMRVARLHVNGSNFDSSYGGDGFANYQVNNPSISNALALQSDGKVVVVGTTQSGDFDLVIIRYNTDGTPDTTFDSDGFVNLGFGEDEEASAVAIDYNGTPASNPYYGTIVVVGDKRPSRSQPSTRFTIGRLLSNGSPDNRFDSDGKLTSPDLTSLPTEYATGVQIQPGGKIVVSGTALSSSEVGNFLLARYLPNGPVDTTYGPFGSGIVHDEWGGDDRAHDSAPNYFGGMLVSGVRNGIAAVAAYTSDGFPETRFSGDGFMTSFAGAAHVATTLDAIAPVRRLVLGGGNHVGRYIDVGTVVNFPGGTFIQETSEASGATLSVIVDRRDSLPTTQRVYISIGGTATAPVFSHPSLWDYNISGLTLPGLNVPRAYVDIPPNQAIATISITPINDTGSEGDETITFGVSADPTYDVGSPPSATIVIRDDDLVAPPAVADARFLYETAPQRVTFRFNQDVAPSVAAGDFEVTRQGGSVPFSFSYNSSLNTATLSFNTPLADGDYIARAIGAGITNAAGQPMPADHAFAFFFLRADADRDRDVDLDDFNALATNFNLTGKTFSQGNFDYDLAGNVNLDDFNILAAGFGSSLGPWSTGRGGAMPLPAFADESIRDRQAADDDPLASILA